MPRYDLPMRGNMNQDALLKLIAESGYNIGYAAKKHLATSDIVLRLPAFIGGRNNLLQNSGTVLCKQTSAYCSPGCRELKEQHGCKTNMWEIYFLKCSDI
jgi:hypothetical protein